MTAEDLAPELPEPSAVPRRIGAALLRPFSSLHGNPGFRALLLSNIAFFGGTWTLSFVLGWMVFQETGSTILVAVFTTVRLLPLLLGPISGVISDRMDRKRLLVIACILAITTVVVLGGLALVGLASFGVLTAGGLLVGLAHSPSQPARAALVAGKVPAAQLSNANALNAMAMNTTLMIGPAVGGLTISAFAAPAALWIGSLWFVASLIALRGVHGGYIAPETPHGSVWRMLAAGVRAIVRLPVVPAVLLITIAVNTMIWSIHQGFMPVFAKDMRLDAAGLGLLLTGFGLGGIVGSLVIAAIGDFRWKGAVFVCGIAGMSVCWILFALARPPALAAAIFVAAGLISSVFGVLQNTLMLSATPPGLQGRAMGLQELAIGAQPIAALAIGAAAQVIGIAATTVISAGLLLLFLAAMALASPALMRYHGTAGA
ncbi:MFS transporter [Microbacterium xylanilyticum]